ncbi:MAG: DUF499 domain-containing protein [Thermodesulfobacteriota bacterium]|nr:DUF499 domain-containing protein [Thermodesulfobacteriota bacterium]
MKYLNELLEIRDSVFEKKYRDTVLEITDLIENKIDPETFFSENFITEGMKTLLKGVFERFDNPNKDGLFKLTQAMGGGKTHNMIAAGLLSQKPELRNQILKSVYKPKIKDPIKVIAFSGRNNPTHGFWGYIAKELGKKETFDHLYNPLDAPGQSDWIKLLQSNKPVLILFDELPEYFKYALKKQMGAGNLADLTTRALTTLFNATTKDELNNVCIIFSDLEAAYGEGTDAIKSILNDFENETRRTARNLIPVQQNTLEIYQILHKKIFKDQAPDSEINEIAKAYGKVIEFAANQDLINETRAHWEGAIRESYPFHPSLKDLYARFKENPGFMQTRGLIRFMRTIVARMWDDKNGWADKSYLIHPFDIDPNDSDTNSELNTINSTLNNAVSKDIAANGNAVAEQIDQEQQNQLAGKTAKLIYMSSLATVQGATKGLNINEIITYTAEPGNKDTLAQIKAKILDELRTRAWYLHPDNAGRLLFKNVENVTSKINSFTKTYDSTQARKVIRDILKEMFEPKLKDLYQNVNVLPAVDEINEEKNKVTLVVYEPYSGAGIHPDLQRKYDDTQFKNRLIFLTSDNQSMDAVYENAKNIKAAEAVISEFQKENFTASDPQFQQAVELKNTYQFRFRSAVTSVFTKLYYPSKRGLSEANIELKFDKNEYNGEEQITKTLDAKQKFTKELSSDAFIQQIIVKLFKNQKELPWNDVLNNAATEPSWVLHKPDALEQIKDSQIKKDAWRMEGNWIKQGPFEKPSTDVRVDVIERDWKTGKTKINVEAVRGDTIYYAYSDSVSENSPELKDEKLITDEMVISFLCVDSKGVHHTGNSLTWEQDIEIRRDWKQQGDKFKVELQAHPHNIKLFYTSDGSDPLTNGASYEDGFIADPLSVIQAYGEKNEVKSEIVQFKLPEAHQTGLKVDKNNPLTFKRKQNFSSTADSYQILGAIKNHNATVQKITVKANHGHQWIELATSDLQFKADELESILNFVKDNLLSKGEIELSFHRLKFSHGQDFLNFIEDTNIEYEQTDIKQSI